MRVLTHQLMGDAAAAELDGLGFPVYATMLSLLFLTGGQYVACRDDVSDVQTPALYGGHEPVEYTPRT